MVKRIAVTGAGGQLAYSLVFRLANGELFGPKQEIALHLLDIPEMKGALEGVAMELEDCAYPLLKEIRLSSDPYEAFKNIDCAFLIGAKPRGPGMERSMLLKENGKIFVEQGKALEKSASKSAKVLVVGNPCNTNCLIAMHHAPSLPRENFHALMRLDQNRAQALLAKQAQVSVDKVTAVTIWGNHSSTQVPDFKNAKINGKKVEETIRDQKWLQEEFTKLVQQRGAAIIAARGKSSAASAAEAALCAMRDLFVPTKGQEWFTTAVISDKNPYGIEPGIIFGFPCRSKGEGKWEIVDGLLNDAYLKEKIAITQKELIEERACIQDLLKA